MGSSKYFFSKKFISATKEMSTWFECVSAPYLRKTVFIAQPIKNAVFMVCGLGFYRFWLNGKESTKGFLSPYISNPDDILDYDYYDLTESLKEGKNVLAFQLGNGMQNAFGGFGWAFENASFRSAPKMACCLSIEYVDGKMERIETDESFLCAPSPLLKDDLRMGEFYDANREINGWNEVDFDDSTWGNAILAETPKGKTVLCQANPIREIKRLKPISIQFGEWTPGISRTNHYGYIYDFGENSAGIVRLKIKGEKGQKITLTFGELLCEGKFYTDNIAVVCDERRGLPDYLQQDIYICKGEGIEEYEPSFTYHGFRYVFVEGITKEQATKELLTYKVMSTSLEERGAFSCSCEKLNKLQSMTRISTLANFWHFPTDCPHREKNGWTADAALSVEHTLLNLNPYNNYREWMRHISAALDERGALPGVVPTAGWGFAWGNGPAWDQVIVEIPYMTYRYTGDKRIVEENIQAIMRYVRYLDARRDENGLIAIGLGDWCAPVPKEEMTPLIVTDSIVSTTIFEKAAFLCKICDNEENGRYCQDLATDIKRCIREKLVDFSTCTVAGESQTAQAMAIHYNVFQEEEKERAFSVLISYLEEKHWHLSTGVLGARVLFHVLADFGYADLAYEMIVDSTPPSYGYWLAQGYTALAEDFECEKSPKSSKNHHFFGDISAFFIKEICGIRYNPNMNDWSYVQIKPCFIEKLSYAKAYHQTPKGKIVVEWTRSASGMALELELPKEIKFDLIVPKGYKQFDVSNTGNLWKFTYKKGD